MIGSYGSEHGSETNSVSIEVERAIDNLVKSGKMPFGISGT